MKFSVREAQEEPVAPVKTVPFVPEGTVRTWMKNSEGTKVDIYKKEGTDFKVIIYPRFMDNGGMYVPEVIVKVLKGDSPKAIVVHSVFMSKTDLAEKGISKKTPQEVKIPIFQQFVQFNKDRYRHMVLAFIKEAEKELAEKEKFKSTEQEGLITTSVYDQLKDFIFNRNESNAQMLLADMKDKGYVRPALRGPKKGMLIPDLKAINRVLFDPELSKAPMAISALIARRTAFDLDPANAIRLGWGIGMNETYWIHQMQKAMNLEGDEASSFFKHASNVLTSYSKDLFNFIQSFNDKIKEQNSKQQQPEQPAEEVPRIEPPTVIEGSMKFSSRG